MPQAIDVVVSVCDGLAAAHAKGIAHRDIKPENIFITADGWVKILDFGVADLFSVPLSETDSQATEEKATGHGSVAGTIRYMSPEQLRGSLIDARADIFSVGCVLHEVLTGASPFARESAAETISAILAEEPPEIRDVNPSVPAMLSQITRRCMEKNREERFQSARDVAFALRLAASKPSQASGPRGQRAKEILVQLESMRGDRYVPPYDIALVHLGLGDVDVALNELSRACDEWNHWVVYLGSSVRGLREQSANTC